jgi:hypothetical protein
MKPVDRSEVLDLGAYEAIRERFLARVIAEKKNRRVAVCDEVSAVFENRDTVLMQIQEMLRTERITSESGIRHEIETYDELLPGDDELSATMFVEINDKDTRDRRLVELAGLEQRIALSIDGELVRARNETRGVLPDRTTAVHYVKFPLGPALAKKLRDGRDAVKVAFVLDHPKLEVKKDLAANVVCALADDLV